MTKYHRLTSTYSQSSTIINQQKIEDAIQKYTSFMSMQVLQKICQEGKITFNTETLFPYHINSARTIDGVTAILAI